MSLLKFIKAQLGISSTPSNNFTLDASAQDGSMKLSRGNAGATTQDIMTVDSAGKVAFPGGSQMLGVDQTWQDVTASRASGATYTNTTGRPIAVSVRSGLGASGSLAGYVNGNLITQQTTGGGQIMNVFVIVPVGQTYLITTTAAFAAWFELR